MRRCSQQERTCYILIISIAKKGIYGMQIVTQICVTEEVNKKSLERVANALKSITQLCKRASGKLPSADREVSLHMNY